MLDKYFNNYFINFCKICFKPSKLLACNNCTQILNNIKFDNCPLFLKNIQYWMLGKYNNEKIKSIGLFLLQKRIPICTNEIISSIKYIKNHKLYNNNYYLEIKINDKYFLLILPYFKNFHENFISYDGLFLYEKYFDNLKIFTSKKEVLDFIITIN